MRTFGIPVFAGMTLMTALLAPSGLSAEQYDYDAAISPQSLRFSPQALYAGEQVRMYANIQNPGTHDITGTVGFYQGPSLLAPPHPFSLKANSVTEDVWIDWTPVEGRYNIMVKIDTVEHDQNPTNNMYLTPMMEIVKRPPPPPPPPQEPPPQQQALQKQNTIQEAMALKGEDSQQPISKKVAQKIAEKLTPKLPINPPAKQKPPATPTQPEPSAPRTTDEGSSRIAVQPPVLTENTVPAPSAPHAVAGERVFAEGIPIKKHYDPARALLIIGILVAAGSLVVGGYFLRKSKA